MSEQEFVSVITRLKGAYANFNFLSTKESVLAWREEIIDYDFKTVVDAVRGFIRNSSYPPTIADIIKGCSKEAKLIVKPYNEAWEDVMRVVRKYGRMNPFDAMDELDEITKKVVKSIGYYDICTSTSIASVRKEFKELYNSYKEDADYNTNANKGNIAIEQKGSVVNG